MASVTSPDLIWALTRNSNRHLVKRDGLQFSSDPFNVMNTNSFKFSGLANRRAVAVQVDKKSNKINVSFKRSRTDARRHPVRSAFLSTLKTHKASRKCRAGRTIRTLTDKSFYRADLTRAVLRRYTALHESQTLKGKKLDRARARRQRGRKANKVRAAKPAAAADKTAVAAASSTAMATTATK